MWDHKSEAQPEDPLVCSVLGAEYYLPWGILPPDGSFFLPMTVSAAEVTPLLRKKAREMDIRIEVRQRCEFGVYGVRVWRIY